MTVSSEFSTKDAKQLATFLSDKARPEGSFNYPQLCGFLFAVCSAPENVPRNDWLSIIFDDQDPGYKDETERDQVYRWLVDLYDLIALGVEQQNASLPPQIKPREPAMSNFEPHASLGLWSQGFLSGHDWLSEVWDEVLPEEWDEEFGESFSALSFFADTELAESLREDEMPEMDLAQAAELMLKEFERGLRSYANIGQELSSHDDE